MVTRTSDFLVWLLQDHTVDIQIGKRAINIWTVSDSKVTSCQPGDRFNCWHHMFFASGTMLTVTEGHKSTLSYVFIQTQTKNWDTVAHCFWYLGGSGLFFYKAIFIHLCNILKFVVCSPDVIMQIADLAIGETVCPFIICHHSKRGGVGVWILWAT
jgi:hypothetical protein